MWINGQIIFFSDNYKATIVSEYGYKNENTMINFILFNYATAGQDRNIKLTRTYAKNALG